MRCAYVMRDMGHQDVEILKWVGETGRDEFNPDDRCDMLFLIAGQGSEAG
jgi:hypothetical protein